MNKKDEEEKELFSCPGCGGKTKLIWVSKDGLTHGYQCQKGHKSDKGTKHMVYLVVTEHE
jgi:hypothetical protein